MTTASDLRQRLMGAAKPDGTVGIQRALSSLYAVIQVADDAIQHAARLEETLAWYEEYVFNARRVGSAGEDARKVLDDDGGKKARIALGGENDDK